MRLVCAARDKYQFFFFIIISNKKPTARNDNEEIAKALKWKNLSL